MSTPTPTPQERAKVVRASMTSRMTYDECEAVIASAIRDAENAATAAQEAKYAPHLKKHCAKCGESDIYTKYDPFSECLNRHCRECGYEWSEKTLDAIRAQGDK